jgi:hypothetical protein
MLRHYLISDKPIRRQYYRSNEGERRAILGSRSLSADRIDRRVEAFQCQPCKERNMRKFIIATLVISMAGLSTSYARDGMHGGGMHGEGMRGGAMQGLMAPANPAVPPSLTPDTRLTGTAPLPPHHQPTSADAPSLPDAMLKPTPEEAAVDRAIGNICRGC